MGTLTTLVDLHNNLQMVLAINQSIVCRQLMHRGIFVAYSCTNDLKITCWKIQMQRKFACRTSMY